MASLTRARGALSGRWIFSLALTLAALGGCSGTTDTTPEDSGTPADTGAASDTPVPVMPCGPADDPDGDGIANRFEGTGDTDGDGVPNTEDPDSDNDGVPDAFEGSYGQPRACAVSPPDSDMDGVYDFVDTDANGDGIADSAQAGPSPGQPGGETTPPADCLQGGGRGIEQRAVSGWTCHPFDTDGDGTPDYADTDADGDRIANTVEIAPGGATAPTDTDMDGTPDWRDIDSDGDTVADRAEGSNDRDGDGAGNWRDLDSDGDSPMGSDVNTDAREAGDGDPATAPVECPRELNVRTLDVSMPAPDGIPDFLDSDSDNDGLSDREEAEAGTDRCNPDSDGDGQLDSAEVAWCRGHTRTGCGSDASVRIPDTDYYLILPFDGPTVNRELEFGSNLRVADVFFLTDTTGSMGGPLSNVRASIATPRTGLIDSITAIIPDTYFGVSHYDDFPTGGFGGTTDRALWPVCPGPPGTTGCIRNSGITVQPPSMSAAVQATVNAITLGGGSDGPESQVEALYQTITGEGLYDRSRTDACMGDPGRSPCWVAPNACVDGARGMPCFRGGALPIVIHFTDADFHNGARDESVPGSGPSNPYSGINPAPHTLDDVISAYNRASGRIINLNAASSIRCEGMRPSSRTAGRPCYDFRVLAEGTSSVDLDGTPLVFDLPGGGAVVSPAFVSSVVGAVNTIATRVPFDINTLTRNDPSNPAGVDATRFIRRRTPSCQIAPANDRCWTEPMDVAHRDAVARTDLSTFYRVVPGTRVRFTIFFQNDVFVGDPLSSSLFRAYIDVVGDGVTVLDTREVYILVPASQGSPG